MYVLIYLIFFIYGILLLTKPSIFSGFGRRKVDDNSGDNHSGDNHERGSRRLKGGGG